MLYTCIHVCVCCADMTMQFIQYMCTLSCHQTNQSRRCTTAPGCVQCSIPAISSKLDGVTVLVLDVCHRGIFAAGGPVGLAPCALQIVVCRHTVIIICNGLVAVVVFGCGWACWPGRHCCTIRVGNLVCLGCLTAIIHGIPVVSISFDIIVL